MITISVPVVYMARDVTILMGGNHIASIKIIKSKRHVKNRYIGNFMYMSFAAGVLCIPYSVLHVASFM